MIRSADYYQGHSDALTEVSMGIAEMLGDTPVTDDLTIKVSDLGALILRLRDPPKPIPGVDPE